MHRFWDHFIKPIVLALKPSVIVEIGAESGANSKNVLEYCQAHGARCHIIDPEEIGNSAEIRPLLCAHGTHHRAFSLDILPQIQDADLYLMDGDHNWYTVYHELRTILNTARAARRGLPLLFFHDISWPYARRDLYYYPETIPAEFRHPCGHVGLVPGQSEALPEGGFNSGLCNATHEGGPRNGVLTAIEDFLAENPELYQLHTMPGLCGLGLLAPASNLSETVRTTIDSVFSLPPPLRAHMEAIERDRLQAYAQYCEMAVHLKKADQSLQRMEKDLAFHMATIRQEKERHIKEIVCERDRQIEAIVRDRDRQIEGIVQDRNRQIAAITKEKDARIADLTRGRDRQLQVKAFEIETLKAELARLHRQLEAREQQLARLQDFEVKMKRAWPYKIYRRLSGPA